MTNKAKALQIDGTELHTVALPPVFETPFRPDIIRKAYTNLLSHSFQKQGRYPMAGEMVSAESRNTGQGIARLARARGEGFARAGQASRSCWSKTRKGPTSTRIMEKDLQKN